MTTVPDVELATEADHIDLDATPRSDASGPMGARTPAAESPPVDTDATPHAAAAAAAAVAVADAQVPACRPLTPMLGALPAHMERLVPLVCVAPPFCDLKGEAETAAPPPPRAPPQPAHARSAASPSALRCYDLSSDEDAPRQPCWVDGAPALWKLPTDLKHAAMRRAMGTVDKEALERVYVAVPERVYTRTGVAPSVATVVRLAMHVGAALAAAAERLSSGEVPPRVYTRTNTPSAEMEANLAADAAAELVAAAELNGALRTADARAERATLCAQMFAVATRITDAATVGAAALDDAWRGPVKRARRAA